MIQVSPSATIFVVEQPIRFNTRLKGTLGVCRDLLQLEPMDGFYVVFRNHSGTMLRIVFYDGDGFWLCEKTFSKGRLPAWGGGPEGVSQISARELAVLLWRGNVVGAAFPDFWKKLSA